MEARVAHLGDLGHTLDSDQLEALELVDIIIIPVGGVYTVNPKIALYVIESIEPKVVIPMHYKIDDKIPKLPKLEELSALEDFLKEASGIPSKTTDEFSIKGHSDLPHSTEIIALP